MPLVFVHGVNVRKDDDYVTSVDARDSLFRRFALKQIVSNPASFQIFNPYWGEYGATFAWNNASLPKSGGETFGSEEQFAYSLLSEVPYSSAPGWKNRWLLEKARQSGLADAVDILWSAAAYSGKTTTSDDLARMGQQAIEYAKANPKPQWLNEVNDDQELLDKLAAEIPPPQATVEAFGIKETLDRLREGADRIALAAGKLTSGAILKFTRGSLNGFLATFMGDIVTYINNRGILGQPGPIVEAILKDIDTAAAIRQNTGEPLIIVAHSMGGNIVYDVLSYFRPDITVDALITVGSQVGLFEELKMFRLCVLDIPAKNDPKKAKMPRPANLKRWLNVYDLEDVLGYAAGDVFEDVKDYPYSTGNGSYSLISDISRVRAFMTGWENVWRRYGSDSLRCDSGWGAPRAPFRRECPRDSRADRRRGRLPTPQRRIGGSNQ
jgi:hypothetical protein